MKTRLLIIQALALIACVSAFSRTTYPKHEERAVWLTTIGGLDWPSRYAQSPSSIERQQKELTDMLDRLRQANINTVMLQTRVRATTIFPSTAETGMEPWDGCLSGRPGVSPGYDALAFAIDECHRRGMALHAWIVTIPVGKWNGTGCMALRKRHPDIVMKIGDEGYMNPAKAETADYLARYCADITRRYDIDGIHLDYIRYPETMRRLPPQDEGRRNITHIVKEISQSVRDVKPWVRISCSPIGKHDDTRRFWSHGWNARQRVMQDAKAWLRDGLMDALYPMMYFRGENFYPFAVDWQEGAYGRTISPGLGIYFLDPKEGRWQLDDVTREMYVLRELGMGFCMFRTKFFLNDVKGIYSFVRETFAPYPALVPSLPSAHGDAPRQPAELTITPHPTCQTISWRYGYMQPEGGIRYNVYGSDTYPVDTDNPENIIATGLSATHLSVPRTRTVAYYAITAADRYGRESHPRQMEKPQRMTRKVMPAWWYVTHPNG